MSFDGKLVHEFEIKVFAEKFSKFFKDQVFLMPNIAPNIIQKIEVHEGNWNSHDHGSIKIWNYTLDGKAEVFKEQVGFDDEKLAISLIGLEGDLFKHYKTYNVTFQVVPKGPERSLAILSLEYEKLDEASPYPYNYLDLITNLTKDVASHFKK